MLRSLYGMRAAKGCAPRALTSLLGETLRLRRTGPLVKRARGRSTGYRLALTPPAPGGRPSLRGPLGCSAAGCGPAREAVFLFDGLSSFCIFSVFLYMPHVFPRQSGKDAGAVVEPVGTSAGLSTGLTLGPGDDGGDGVDAVRGGVSG